VNWRAAGCLLLGIAVFLTVGLLGMSIALRDQEGCPSLIRWADRDSLRHYLVEGTPAPSPAFSQEGEAVEIGSTFFGLTTRQAFGPPGSSPSTRAEDFPEVVALDCADGTFQTYQWDGVSRTPPPSPESG
jgi:uncharacterized membrane protein YedE/YeeE